LVTRTRWLTSAPSVMNEPEVRVTESSVAAQLSVFVLVSIEEMKRAAVRL